MHFFLFCIACWTPAPSSGYSSSSTVSIVPKTHSIILSLPYFLHSAEFIYGFIYHECLFKRCLFLGLCGFQPDFLSRIISDISRLSILCSRYSVSLLLALPSRTLAVTNPLSLLHHIDDLKWSKILFTSKLAKKKKLS